MKKVVFFSKNLHIGGMEKALVTLLNQLVKFYDVTLILEEKDGLLLTQLNEKINVREYTLSKYRNVFLRKFVNFVKRAKWAINNKNHYDFSCNYATYSVIGSRLAQIASKNSSYYIHSNYYEVFTRDCRQVQKFFKPHRLKKFRNIICVSIESQKELQKIFVNQKGKFCTINNLIDYKNILRLSEEENSIKLSHKDINLVFIGRLDNTSKNLDLLLDSFRIILKKDRKYKLYIVGRGAYLDNIKKYLSEYKMEKNVILIDELENPYSLLKRCDCLILTSNYEGFPVTYLEALVLNKPIMTTVMCSDESIDIRDYAIKLEKNSKLIAKQILEFKKEVVEYKIDFEKFNEDKLEKIKSLIEGDE